MQRRNDKGMFTVSTSPANWREVFLCITIVVSTIALLSPSADRSRPKARIASCMSNMKQIGLALAGYAQDYDTTLPSGAIASDPRVVLPSASAAVGRPAARPGYSRGLGVGWAGGMQEYVKSTGLFKCPDDKTEAVESANKLTLYPVSYALNEWCAGQKQSVLALPPTTVLAFESSGPHVNLVNRTESGSLVYSPVGDGESDFETGNPAPGDAFDANKSATRLTINNRGKFARHDINGAGGGGSMYLLGDGHVKFLRFDQVSVGKRPVSQTMLGTTYTVSFNPTE